MNFGAVFDTIQYVTLIKNCMKRTFLEAIENRRSIYSLDNKHIIDPKQIEQILLRALEVVPSPFNSRSTRLVLLSGQNHTKFWSIVKETLRKIIPPTAFASTEQKIDGAFAAGSATVLFYIDTDVTKAFQSQFPTYADRFPAWGEHSSAMHQFAIWTMVEDAELGASLQHYNPLIDSEVAEKFNIPQSWQLVAQMPMGNPLARPDTRAEWDASEHLISL